MTWLIWGEQRKTENMSVGSVQLATLWVITGHNTLLKTKMHCAFRNQATISMKLRILTKSPIKNIVKTKGKHENAIN